MADGRTAGDGRRLVELDALRGIAALVVVGFHFTTRYDDIYGHAGALPFAMPWGHYGVQLFFGISGFVIFMTLRRTRRPLDFVVSRASRLYPAYWAAILLTTAIVALGDMREFRHPPLVVAANFTMVQGLFALPSVDGVYWTLLVELCFYGAMFALWRLGALERIEAVLLGWIALKWLWWAAPLLAGNALSHTLGALVIQAWIPFFAVGICAYRVFAGERSWRQVATVLLFALATVLAVDGPAAFAVAAIVVATLFAFVSGRLRALDRRLFAWLGAISYTLYLLHENIGFTLIRHAEAAGAPVWLALSIATGVVLGLATFVTYTVERPAMRWIRERYRLRQAAVAAL
jgi:peptidoglycan/LPS O-acetylase OafA/YrhL